MSVCEEVKFNSQERVEGGGLGRSLEAYVLRNLFGARGLEFEDSPVQGLRSSTHRPCGSGPSSELRSWFNATPILFKSKTS